MGFAFGENPARQAGSTELPPRASIAFGTFEHESTIRLRSVDGVGVYTRSSSSSAPGAQTLAATGRASGGPSRLIHQRPESTVARPDHFCPANGVVRSRRQPPVGDACRAALRSLPRPATMDAETGNARRRGLRMRSWGSPSPKILPGRQDLWR